MLRYRFNNVIIVITACLDFELSGFIKISFFDLVSFFNYYKVTIILNNVSFVTIYIFYQFYVYVGRIFFFPFFVPNTYISAVFMGLQAIRYDIFIFIIFITKFNYYLFRKGLIVKNLCLKNNSVIIHFKG